MLKKFNEYELSKELKEALVVLGYEKPTKIQQMAIPPILEGKDIMAKSQTGSGKTAAFAIPLCDKIQWEIKIPQVLVLEPTRELTVQVREELFQIGRKKRIKVADLFGGFPIEKQILTLKQKTHIAVGTPGRILDHLRRDSLKLQKVCTVVIDEADIMLDMGFQEDVESILKQLPDNRQVLLFSATLNEEVQQLVRNYQREPVLVEVNEHKEQKPLIIEKSYLVELEDKYKIFKEQLMKENPDHAMIFCGTKEMVNVLCRKMRKDGMKASMIHGDLDQSERLRTVDGFRQGMFRYLIATDVVARGIDFQNLSHVINYDFPTGKESYVHRIGRTGRNGATGIAINFITKDDQRMKEQIEQFVGYTLELCEAICPTEEEKNIFFERQREKVKKIPKKGAGFAKEIMRLSIGGGKKSKMRTGDLVGAICHIEGLTDRDIGTIDIRDSLCYVEILNGKGNKVLNALQEKPIKGKIRKVRKTKG